MDIGIDLGTTYSVIAAKGKVELQEGWSGDYIEEFDVTIIHGPDGDPRIPSVFWAAKDDPSQVVVGNEAKAKAEEGESPIMFAKRSMGTQEPLKLHDRTLTAREVSAQILRFIRNTAEQALGKRVERAVITHPAYFDPNQVEETREAAKEAGFDMSAEDQLCMEPAAAAVAYLYSDDRDPLRILTYDLGGGTFDVTVLERREGVIELKSFDGDHLLGGYNFDRELVSWLIEKAEQRSGRKAVYDDENPEHRSRRAQLLVLAEQKKEELSRSRNDKIKLAISASRLLVDESGQPIPIMERISREEFVELIDEYLENTAEACIRAIKKANVPQLDEILLVGGSTHGPWVHDLVKKRLERDPHPNTSPDLCVAAGAAILASKLPERTRGGGLRLDLDVPRVSPETLISVTGSLRTDDGAALPDARRSALMVQLEIEGGAPVEPVQLTGTGGFVFDDVELFEEEPTQFTFTVKEGGQTVLTQKLVVHYDEDAVETGDLYTVLPKPLYLLTGEGPRAIAEEGVVLPAKCSITCVLALSVRDITIDVLQGGNKIGTVRVDDIPEQAGEGSKVIVDVEVTKDARLTGTAKVYLKNSETVAKECSVDVRFPPLPRPDVEQLRARLTTASSALEQASELEQDRGRRVLLKGKGQKLAKTGERLLKEHQPDVQELERAVTELEKLVKPPEDDLQPPRKQFVDMVGLARELIAAQASNPDIQDFKGRVDQIERDGLQAAEEKQRRNWALACDAIRKVIQRIMPKELGDQIGRGPVNVENIVQRVDEQKKALNQAHATWKRENPAKLRELEPAFASVGRALEELASQARALSGMDDGRAQAAASQITSTLSDAAKKVGLLTKGIVVN